MKTPKKKSNNMRTRAWGPPMWFSITCVLMGYPEKNPTNTQKRDYVKFLKSLGKVMPCNLCRDSYKKFLKELPLTQKVLRSRKNLVMWFFKIHNKVNQKLNTKQLTQSQMEKKYKYYNQFRAAGCSKTDTGCNKTFNKNPKRCKIKVTVDKKFSFKKQKK